MPLNFLRMVCVLLFVLLVLSLANDWAPTRPLRTLWRKYNGYVKWYVTSSPATFVYLFILFITTWVLLGMPQEIRERFIAAQSTNLRHLTSNPFRALVRSAFFVTNKELVGWGVLFGVVMAPAERWLGTFRMVAVFVMGHVVATAAAALDVWVHITWLHAPDSLWNAQDTGVSYGFMAVAALMVYRLTGWSRWVLAGLLALVVLYGIPEHGFTARGHTVAVLVGLCLYRMTRLPDVVDRCGPGRSIVALWRRSLGDGPYPPTPAQKRAYAD